MDWGTRARLTNGCKEDQIRCNGKDARDITCASALAYLILILPISLSELKLYGPTRLMYSPERETFDPLRAPDPFRPPLRY